MTDLSSETALSDADRRRARRLADDTFHPPLPAARRRRQLPGRRVAASWPSSPRRHFRAGWSASRSETAAARLRRCDGETTADRHRHRATRRTSSTRCGPSSSAPATRSSALLHPQIVVAARRRRRRSTRVFDIDDNADVPDGAIVESWMHIELEPRSRPSEHDAARRPTCDRVLDDVLHAVADAPHDVRT